MSGKYGKLLKNRNYMAMLSANLINRFGDCVDVMAVTWLMYQISGSASASALNYGLNAVPTILLQPVCGAFVEKRDLKKVMLISDLCRFLIIGSVAVLVITGKIQPWMIIISTFLISTVEAFRVPAQTPMVTMILDEEDYTIGESLSRSLTQAVQLVSIGIAGSMVSLLGVSTCILIDCGCFIVSMLLIGSMKLEKKKRPESSNSNILQDTLEGFRYMKGNRIALFICITAVLLNGLMTPLSAMEAALCSEIFHRGPEIISIINVFFTLGGIAGSVIYPKIEDKAKPVSMLSTCFMGVALFYGAIMLCAHVYENTALIYAIITVTPLLVGLSAAFINIFTAVLEMKTVEKDYLSRVSAIQSALCSLGVPVASFMISIGARWLSVYKLVAITGALAVVSGLRFMTNRKIRKLL